ncbi:MAG: ribulokinase [Cytophagales bacterium]|nr:MAG: ribulokinase [Cytophagales bacterium]
MMKNKYTIGVDYGTDSVRSIVANIQTVEIVGSDVFYYPRWKEGKYCKPTINQYRQHPKDYVEGLETTIKNAITHSKIDAKNEIIGITIDTTGSTPCAVNNEGIPLAMLGEFQEEPDAMFVLWKDHTAIKEADHINHVSRTWGGIDYTKYSGGVYSSEWFWAKILHIYKKNSIVRNATYSWVEHCDWITALLTGCKDPKTMKRSRCAAGHKALWNEEWDGLPSEEFLITLDSSLKGLRENLYQDTYQNHQIAGNLCEEWSNRLGLSQSVVIGIGAFDAHLGAIGAEIKPNYLTKVMGTSTCDMLVSSNPEISTTLIKGICGQVNGSILPNCIGLEAGQSAFGDVYAWFTKLITQPNIDILLQSEVIDAKQKQKLIEEIKSKIILQLNKDAASLPLDSSSPLAIDWFNGRRTPDANQNLKAAITNLTIGINAAQIFKALVEATAFGAYAIIERFRNEGVIIEGLIGLGGVAIKAPFIMQTIADVCNLPIQIAKVEQACALGAAMAAAVAAGAHQNFEEAQKAMGQGFETTYYPDATKNIFYQKRYQQYKALGNFVETVEMK